MFMQWFNRRKQASNDACRRRAVSPVVTANCCSCVRDPKSDVCALHERCTVHQTVGNRWLSEVLHLVEPAPPTPNCVRVKLVGVTGRDARNVTLLHYKQQAAAISNPSHCFLRMGGKE
ncbi:hypothetical protein GW17_00004587 [Ensete ventricosum]|uniref:Uncharacterized protein n=1 Tax=Ensete ventricosum TaxID=4639 RepID=A0A444G7M9_ENSVE|nr:hypothetical protein B296_00002478 [Ensete ventricosum]RWW30821.1 hypothetical protein GW17_00004587 [Ensete ventricosum]RZR80411.1 hypothetical protein BHM03_00006442 [Ensete ventricosum]